MCLERFDVKLPKVFGREVHNFFCSWKKIGAILTLWQKVFFGFMLRWVTSNFLQGWRRVPDQVNFTSAEWLFCSFLNSCLLNATSRLFAYDRQAYTCIVLNNWKLGTKQNWLTKTYCNNVKICSLCRYLRLKLSQFFFFWDKSVRLNFSTRYINMNDFRRLS